MNKVQIKVNVGNALSLLGRLYKHPADALKEYVSNALDEWRRLKSRGEAPPFCAVDFEVSKEAVVIRTNTPGMGRERFEEALSHVAESLKRGVKYRGVPQIGRLGIGLWAFLQVGRRCSIATREVGGRTLLVSLREGSDVATFSKPDKDDILSEPGFVVRIEGLYSNPLKTRGPLVRERLEALLSEKFAFFIHDGSLRATLKYGTAKASEVPAPKIEMRRVAETAGTLSVARGDKAETVFYFDPTGKGRVVIRHAGVVVVEDMGALGDFETDNIFDSGFVTGAIDADFLSPLPARMGFEEDAKWTAFVAAIEKITPLVQKEVRALQEVEENRKMSEIHKRVLTITRSVLDLTTFRDLELPGGMGRANGQAATGSDGKGGADGKADGKRAPAPTSEAPEGSLEPGASGSGPRLRIIERPFEDGAGLHSRFEDGEIQVNTLHPDYRREVEGPTTALMVYEALLLGKEVLAHNDRSGVANDMLERLLSFGFELRHRAAPIQVARAGRRQEKTPKPLAPTATSRSKPRRS